MQYSLCNKCIHNGNVCKMVMANAITTLGNLEHLINYSQTRNTEHKCQLKIDYSCENFVEKG